jgi:hypothetical protein
LEPEAEVEEVQSWLQLEGELRKWLRKWLEVVVGVEGLKMW